MLKTLPFDEHVAEYEAWFDRYPFVFESEVEAIREMLPEGKKLHGIEVGVATGRFSKALDIKEGIEPSSNMRDIALKRGIEVLSGYAEHLPYGDLRFDFVVMVFCISYFDDLSAAFNEARRVLKNGGVLIVGFIDKDSVIGQFYENHKKESIFYKDANFYSTERVIDELKKLKFKHLEFSQTLFHALDEIKSFEPTIPGYGEGSFITIKAIR